MTEPDAPGPARVLCGAHEEPARKSLTLWLFIGLGVAFLALGGALALYVHTNNKNLDNRSKNRDAQTRLLVEKLDAAQKQSSVALTKADSAAALAQANADKLHTAACYLVSVQPPNQPASAKANTAQFAILAGCPVPK